MKLFSIFCFSILLSFTGIAQDYKFETGIQGGRNISLFRFNNPTAKEDRKPHFGYSTSLYFQYNINKTFSLKIQPGIETKGFKNKKTTVNPSDRTYTTEGRALNYVTIPLLAKASFGNKVQFFVNAGPYVGILLSESLLYTDYGSNVVRKMSTKDYPNMRYCQSIDIGIASGIGISIALKKRCSLSFEFRDNLGLTNINKVNSSKEYAIKTHTLNFMIGFGYKFGAKK